MLKLKRCHPTLLAQSTAPNEHHSCVYASLVCMTLQNVVITDLVGGSLLMSSLVS